AQVAPAASYLRFSRPPRPGCGRLDDTADRAQKIGRPRLAPEVAVGDRAQTDLFLHPDRIMDQAIFDLAQRGRRNLAARMAFARRLQLRRSQQAADMIRAERGVLSDGGCAPPVLFFPFAHASPPSP